MARYVTEADLLALLRAAACRYGCTHVDEMSVPELYRALAQCSAREEVANEPMREARKEWPRIVKAAFDPSALNHQAAKAALAFRGKFRNWADVEAALSVPLTPPTPPATTDDIAAEAALTEVPWGVLDAAAVLHAVRDRTDRAPQPGYRRGEERRKRADLRHRGIDKYFAELPAKNVAGPSFPLLGVALDPLLSGKEKAGSWAHACCRQYAVMRALRREPVPATLLLYHDTRGAVIPPQDIVDRWSALVRAMCWRVDTVGPEAARAYASGELDLVAILAVEELHKTLPEKQRRIVELMSTLSDAREHGGHGMDEKWFAETLALATLSLAGGQH
jgi:hypothetical protein